MLLGEVSGRLGELTNGGRVPESGVGVRPWLRSDGWTAIANVLMAMAAGRFGAARASSTTFLIPVVALVLGVVLRDERVAILSVVGGLVCLVGAWLMKRASSH